MNSINGIYVVKDDVSGTYTGMVNLFATHAQAERAFRTAFLKGRLAEIQDNPGDFHVYCVGTFNIETGELVAQAPELICHFIGFLKGVENE